MAKRALLCLLVAVCLVAAASCGKVPTPSTPSPPTVDPVPVQTNDPEGGHEEVVPTPSVSPTPTPTATVPSEEGELKVHFLDVGQGDATLLQGPDFTILIDAGTHDRNDVTPYLRSVGVGRIDLLVGTHPHSDHIGQFPQVIQAFDVREVWMSGDVHTTQTFERALDAVIESGADYYEPRAGEQFTFGSSRVKVLHPAHLTGDLHEGSISLRISFGNVNFVFTGDAEAQSEQEMLARGYDLSTHVLQLGHHGSSTSSSQAFLNAVRPEVAIYSAAEGNTYGHPHDEVIARLLTMGIVVYGTDVHGTVVVTTDGRDYQVTTQRQGQVITATPPQETVEPSPTPVPQPDDNCGPGQVNINSASKDDLMLIIHIGEVRSDELIRLRPFRSIDDLTRISGIGEARLRDIKEQGIACV